MRRPPSREEILDAATAAAERSTDAAPTVDFEESTAEGGEGGTTAVLEERFTYLEEVGRGGTGAVYRAADSLLERRLAVKVLEAGSRRGSRARRFRREAQITSQLDHPNIPPIHDYGIDDRGRPYIMMKLVDGESLQTAIARAGDERLRPERLERFLLVLTKVCEAVSFAHSRGVVHRDIKPANVMVGGFGQVYLMDWGLAHRLPRGRAAAPAGPGGGSGTFGLAGTVSYMAPEQAGGRVDLVDERTDVFQLGATLYHVLAGRPPYVGEVLQDLLDRVTRGDFPALEEVVGARLPSGLSRIARKAMARDPADRHRSASDFQQEIERFLRGSWHLPTRQFPRGHRIVREGEPGDTAYIIVEGRCQVFRGAGGDRVVLREMGPGDAFGETAVVSEKPRTATVEALEDVVLMVVTREALTEGLGISSWVGSFVIGLAERFRDLSDQLHELEGKPPEDPAPAADL